MIDFRKNLPSVLIPAVLSGTVKVNDVDYSQFRFAGGQLSRPSAEVPAGLNVGEDLILICKMRSSRFVPIVDAVQFDCRATNKKYNEMTQETFDAGAFGELSGVVKYQSENTVQIDSFGMLFKVFDVPRDLRFGLGQSVRLVVKLATTVNYSSFGARENFQFVFHQLLN